MLVRCCVPISTDNAISTKYRVGRNETRPTNEQQLFFPYDRKIRWFITLSFRLFRFAKSFFEPISFENLKKKHRVLSITLERIERNDVDAALVYSG